VLTPKQAAEIAAQSAGASGAMVDPRVVAVETMLDARLVQQGSAALSCSAAPPLGALVAAAPVIMELERRYRAAGWKTRLDGGTLLIETPTTAVSSRRRYDARCSRCGAAIYDSARCLVCHAERAEVE
jgi:hypothetical protein